MDAARVLAELESLGTAQNRKVYARHGVAGPMFGLSYANLGKLRKRFDGDHELALALWDSGNHDARVLATMIADPARMTGKTVDAWAKDLDNRVLAGALSELVWRTKVGVAKAEKWSKSKNEWLGSLAYATLTSFAKHADFDDSFFAAWIERIETSIHAAKNHVRYSMNTALIAIGARPGLTKSAVAAAKRIGKVDVDHGDTSCKTPDAASYIQKAVAHRKAKTARSKAKKGPAKSG